MGQCPSRLVLRGVKSDPENQDVREAQILSEAAKCIGINEQRVFEARQIEMRTRDFIKKSKRKAQLTALTEINPS
jgi:hypothetical protein